MSPNALVARIHRELSEEQEEKPRRNWWRPLWIACASVLVLLLAAEIAMRLLWSGRAEVTTGAIEATRLAAADALNIRFGEEAAGPLITSRGVPGATPASGPSTRPTPSGTSETMSAFLERLATFRQANPDDDYDSAAGLQGSGIPRAASSSTAIGGGSTLRAEADAFAPDERLLWRLRPGSNIDGLPVSAHGYLGSDPGALQTALAQTSPTAASRAAKPAEKAARVRVLVLADSVGVLAYRPFPNVAQRMVRAALRMQSGARSSSGLNRPVEFLNASVPGYSSRQALAKLQLLLPDIKPDVVVVCCGWADRSPALNFPDQDLLTPTKSAPEGIRRLLNSSRLIQWLFAPADEKVLRRRKVSSNDSSAVRVGPLQYENNLSQIAQVCRDAGVLPILTTQPDALDLAAAEAEENLTTIRADGVSGYDPRTLRSAPASQMGRSSGGSTSTRTAAQSADLNTDGLEISSGASRPSLQSPRQAARAYNDLVRRVAAASGAALLDFEEEFRRRERRRLFEPDGIHLTAPGHNLAARLLFSILRDRGILTRQEVDTIATLARYDTTSPDRLGVAWSLSPSHVDAVLPTSATSATSDAKAGKTLVGEVDSAPPVNVGVLVQNAGNTRWLTDYRVERYGRRTFEPRGGVSVVAEWRSRSADGKLPIDTDQTTSAAASKSPRRRSPRDPDLLLAARAPLAHDVLPGESTSLTLALRRPARPGDYALEIGLRAEGLGDLSRLGADTTTLTLSARQP